MEKCEACVIAERDAQLVESEEVLKAIMSTRRLRCTCDKETEWTDFWFNLGLACIPLSLLIFAFSKELSLLIAIGFGVCMYLDIKKNNV